MVYKNLPVSGFEPRTSGIGSDRSVNWATTTALRINHLFPPHGGRSKTSVWSRIPYQDCTECVSVCLYFVCYDDWNREHSPFGEGSITVQLTSCLTGLDLTKRVKLKSAIQWCFHFLYLVSRPLVFNNYLSTKWREKDDDCFDQFWARNKFKGISSGNVSTMKKKKLI